MALRAGYYGVKRDDAVKLNKMPGIAEIGDGLTLSDDGTLTGDAGTVVANPEDEATVTLTKIQVGETVYTVPGNDNTKCYQTDDDTESSIVDADFVPFLDSSAASGAGAPRKSTWSNFCNKVAAKLNSVFFPRSEQAVLGAVNIWNTTLISSGTSGGYTYAVDADDRTIHITGNHAVEDAGVIECGTVHLEPGTYYLSGAIGGTLQKLGLQVWASSANTDQWYSWNGSDVVMNLASAKDCKLRIWFSGVTSDVDVAFKPMIALGPNQPYAPYAMTNKELTEKVQGIIDAATNAADFAAFKTAIGNL